MATTLASLLSSLSGPQPAMAIVNSTNPANNYYFPMAKYRYLPRILRAEIACDKLSSEPLEKQDWESLVIVWERMDDATTAMPLYISSVEGSRSSKKKKKSDIQKDMAKATKDYTDACKDLKVAIDKRNIKNARAAIEKASGKMDQYRVLAKID